MNQLNYTNILLGREAFSFHISLARYFLNVYTFSPLQCMLTAPGAPAASRQISGVLRE